MIDTQVHGDPVRPGVEAGVPLEAVQALVCLGEGLLRDVECIIPVSKHTERERGDLALVALDQLPEGVPVALPGPLDELTVARPHGTFALSDALGPRVFRGGAAVSHGLPPNSPPSVGRRGEARGAARPPPSPPGPGPSTGRPRPPALPAPARRAPAGASAYGVPRP